MGVDLSTRLYALMLKIVEKNQQQHVRMENRASRNVGKSCWSLVSCLHCARDWTPRKWPQKASLYEPCRVYINYT